MADWKKVEQTPDATAASTPEKESQKTVREAKRTAKKQAKREKLIAYGKKLREKEAERKARVDKNGHRRGRYRWAAPVGFVTTLLAIVGVVAVVATGIGMVRELTDDTALREEITYFLQPLTAYNPIPDFVDVNEEDIDELLRAAVWRITEAERIRMLREKDENTKYELDNNGRLIVPVAEVEASYKALFGEEAVLNNRTLGEDDVEYSETNKTYFVPFNFVTSLHQPVIDTIRRNGNVYHVRIAFVSSADLEVDERGNTIQPTPDMGAFAQIYVLKRVDGQFTVTAVGSEAEEQGGILK